MKINGLSIFLKVHYRKSSSPNIVIDKGKLTDTVPSIVRNLQKIENGGYQLNRHAVADSQQVSVDFSRGRIGAHHHMVNALHSGRELQETAMTRILQCRQSGSSYLDLSSLGLRSLPELPKHVSHLNLTNNRLETLPALPPELVHLQVANNSLRALPELPESLICLIINNNDLNALPDTLPAKLQCLECRDNHLVTLPPTVESMPDYPFGYIAAQGNPFTSEFVLMLQARHDAGYGGPRIIFPSERKGWLRPEVKAIRQGSNSCPWIN